MSFSGYEIKGALSRADSEFGRGGGGARNFRVIFAYLDLTPEDKQHKRHCTLSIGQGVEDLMFFGSSARRGIYVQDYMNRQNVV